MHLRHKDAVNIARTGVCMFLQKYLRIKIYDNKSEIGNYEKITDFGANWKYYRS